MASYYSLEAWIDSVSQQSGSSSSIANSSQYNCDDSDKENEGRRPFKRRRMADKDADQTPRGPKRTFDAIEEYSEEHSEGHSEDSSQAASHRSGNFSPVKQMRLLEDEANPILFRDFRKDDPEEVRSMHLAIKRFANGYGIIAELSEDALYKYDDAMLNNPICSDSARSLLGTMPEASAIMRIVSNAQDLSEKVGSVELMWNSKVHLPLLELALETSQYVKELAIDNVQSAKVIPGLARKKMPKRVVDYVVVLRPDKEIEQAWKELQPEYSDHKSWNHIESTRAEPIALNIETKSPIKSWTDGKPHLALWIDAWLRRLRMLGRYSKLPTIPIFIAQGHDWYLLMVSQDDPDLIVRGHVNIGNTLDVFGTMKVITVLHWALKWAEEIWRPWFKALIAKKPAQLRSAAPGARSASYERPESSGT